MGDSVSDPQRIDPDLAKTIASLERAIKANPHSEPPESYEPTAAKVIRLPLWSELVRGAPNALLRSAFFAAIHSKKRQRLGTQTSPDKEPQGITIAAQDGICIKYAGTQLNQYDADVFFEVLHRARHHPLETECFFTGYSFLKAIGRTTNNLNYEDLDNSLRRLRFGEAQIEWSTNGRRYKFVGGLISEYIREESSKLFKVTFSKTIRDLFAPASWTQLEWEERMALKGKPLAQWLHSYFSTHAAPYPISVAFLHEKTGSPTRQLKHFRTELKNALTALEKILGWKATWDGDLLTLKRPPSASQARHLRKARASTKRLPKPKRSGLTAIGSLFSET
jgi:TrfA protein